MINNLDTLKPLRVIIILLGTEKMVYVRPELAETNTSNNRGAGLRANALSRLRQAITFKTKEPLATSQPTSLNQAFLSSIIHGLRSF